MSIMELGDPGQRETDRRPSMQTIPPPPTLTAHQRVRTAKQHLRRVPVEQVIALAERRRRERLEIQSLMDSKGVGL